MVCSQYKLRIKIFRSDSSTHHIAIGKKKKICGFAGSLLTGEARCGISLLASGDPFLFFIELRTHLQKWKYNYYRIMVFELDP